MEEKQLNDLIDVRLILLQLSRLKAGQIKKATLDSYTSRALNPTNPNLKDYLNNYIVKALYKYSQTNGDT